MPYLPYTVLSDTGDTFDIEFPLSEHTEDSMRVHQILSTVLNSCLLYTSPSPRDRTRSRMPSSA